MFLGTCVGQLVIILNCDNSSQDAWLGRIVAGAWACLNEFRRPSRRIHSKVSDKIATVRIEIQNRVDMVKDFSGKAENVIIESGTGIFVTMNPKYKGRRELVEIFKACLAQSQYTNQTRRKPQRCRFLLKNS